MRNKYQPIIYSIVLLTGIFLGRDLLRDDSKLQDNHSTKINAIIKLIEDNYVDGFDITEHEDEILHSIMK